MVIESTPRKLMVARQIAVRGVKDEAVLRAMRDVPRDAFVPIELREFAHEDAPLPIDSGQTISQPYIVALMVEALDLEPDDHVLEVGSGSGYYFEAILPDQFDEWIWFDESSAVRALGRGGEAPSLAEGHPFATVDR
jgi:protein-L-isoaspartate(D-aspartate) O-methyltransferase